MARVSKRIWEVVGVAGMRHRFRRIESSFTDTPLHEAASACFGIT